MTCAAVLIRCIFVGMGILSMLTGIYMYFNWIELFTKMRGKKMALTSQSPSFQSWKISPIPLYLDVYLFNWTNSNEFNDTQIKPNFQQLGPYRFRELRDKVDIHWHEHNNTVSFRKKAIFHFVPEESNGTLDDHITTVNTIAHSIALRSKDANLLKKIILERTLRLYDEKLTVTKTAKELLFHGYQDPLVDMGTFFSVFNKDIKVPYDRVGWLYSRNNSAEYEGIFNMFTGTDDITKLGQIYSWNYETRTKFYDDNCGRVRGSLGEFFPSNLTTDDTIWLFISNICRAVPLDYTETVIIHGVTGYKFTGTERLLNNGSLFPENKCFCINGKCENSGVFNVAPCQHDSPIYMSYPHFYKADSMYANAVNGLNPDKEKHELFLVLEPNTGIPMDVGGGFQANYLLEPVASIRPFDKIKRSFIPLMWAEERVTVSPQMAADIALVPMILFVGQLAAYILLVVGVVLICYSPIKSLVQHLYQRCKIINSHKHKRRKLEPNTNASCLKTQTAEMKALLQRGANSSS